MLQGAVRAPALHPGEPTVHPTTPGTLNNGEPGSHGEVLDGSSQVQGRARLQQECASLPRLAPGPLAGACGCTSGPMHLYTPKPLGA